MNAIRFVKAEVSAAVARGVRQCVIIGSHPALREAFKSAPDPDLQVFAVDEEQASLATALEKSQFSKVKASLFLWLGGAGYRTVDAAVASLAFIASLPKGSEVVLDYAVERSAAGSLTQTSLDALASRINGAGSTVRHFIQPQAVAAMLRSLGFHSIIDLPQDELHACGGHLVSAIV